MVRIVFKSFVVVILKNCNISPCLSTLAYSSETIHDSSSFSFGYSTHTILLIVLIIVQINILYIINPRPSINFILYIVFFFEVLYYI
jgi:hypothetical protein